MIALQITSLKIFMNQLLSSDIFDIFLLEEATLSCANNVTIDGRINKDFFPQCDQTPEHIPYEFQTWRDMKSLCYQIIKGKHTPLFFKFVLLVKPEHMKQILEKEGVSVTDSQIKSFVLTIKYDGAKAIITTGTAYHTFVLDKTPDVCWDRSLTKYLSKKEVPYEIL